MSLPHMMLVCMTEVLGLLDHAVDQRGEHGFHALDLNDLLGERKRSR